MDTYDQYIEIINSSDKVTILDSGSTNNVDYILYNYNDQEYNYLVKINNSNTGFLVGNTVSEDSVKECFEHLTFYKE